MIDIHIQLFVYIRMLHKSMNNRGKVRFSRLKKPITTLYQDTFWRLWSHTACNTFLHLEFIEHLYMFMNFNPSIFELKFVKVGDCFWKYCFYLDRWLRYLSQNRPDKKCKHGLFISTSITCYWIKGKSVFFVFWASLKSNFCKEDQKFIHLCTW